MRLEIGDTDESRALFQDAEIDDLVLQEGSVLNAAARACEVLSVRFARDYSFSADGASFQKGGVSEMYRKLAIRLRARARGFVSQMPTRKDAYSDDISAEESPLT